MWCGTVWYRLVPLSNEGSGFWMRAGRPICNVAAANLKWRSAKPEMYCVAISSCLTLLWDLIFLDCEILCSIWGQYLSVEGAHAKNLEVCGLVCAKDKPGGHTDEDTWKRIWRQKKGSRCCQRICVNHIPSMTIAPPWTSSNLWFKSLPLSIHNSANASIFGHTRHQKKREVIIIFSILKREGKKEGNLGIWSGMSLNGQENIELIRWGVKVGYVNPGALWCTATSRYQDFCRHFLLILTRSLGFIVIDFFCLDARGRGSPRWRWLTLLLGCRRQVFGCKRWVKDIVDKYRGEKDEE